MNDKTEKILADLSDLKIVIFTRSCNKSLYVLSGKTIQLPFKRKRLKYTTAEGYLYAILKTNADIVINIDEDAFVLDNDSLIELIHYMVKNKYANCGFPDGGVLPIRFHNPLITNPFFNIFDLRVLRNNFSFSKIKQYSIFDDIYKKNSPINLLRTEFKYDMHEPFYPFFLWISQNFKVLYLDADQHPDGSTTILKNHQGIPFIIHAWYSRHYNDDEFHTKRINSLINECGIQDIDVYNDKLEKLVNKIYMPRKMFVRRVLKKLRLVNYI